jgi:RNA polymerase sigma-70 factor (ECF subfamily)
MSRRPDQDLLVAAGRGSQDSFGVLVARHQRALFQFIHRFLGNVDADTVEDLAQQVFTAAWMAAPSYRPRAKVLTWLLRIATNRCLNFRRSSRLRATIPLESGRVPREAGSICDNPAGLALARERTDNTRAVVASLPPNQRAAILLRHFDGLSYAEIAEVLETSVAAVESLLFRARATLRKVLAEAGIGASPQVSARTRAEDV